MELRIIAHMSQDPVLLAALLGETQTVTTVTTCALRKDAGGGGNGAGLGGGWERGDGTAKDVFYHMASSWMKVPLDKVSVAQRDRAKRVCYGLLYGMGAASLSNELGVPLEEGTRLLESFKGTYSGVTAWMQQVIADCRRVGYVTTIAGRRRGFPDIMSPNSNHRSAAERQAINSMVQGSAADILRKGLLSIARQVPVESGRIVMQVHDEVILEVRQEVVSTVAKTAQACLESVLPMSVPLKTKVRCGRSWGALEQIGQQMKQA